MTNIRKRLDNILDFFSGVILAIMVLLTSWQVFTRYLLKNPSAWSEEMVSYLFAWLTLFGASLVTSERGHMNISVIIDKAKGNLRKYLEIFSEIIAFLFSLCILIYGGLKITKLAMGQLTASIGISVGVFYIALPLCGLINIIYIILNIIEILNKKEDY